MTSTIFKWRGAALARRVRKWVRAGNRARERRDWRVAADCYAAALALDPGLAAIHVQYGNMLKEAGERDAARSVYQRALLMEPGNGDTWLQLGHTLKLLGRVPQAVEAYGRAIIVDPNLSTAAVELADLGAIDRIPPLLHASRDRLGAELQALSAQIRDMRRDFRPYTDAARSYTAFRQLYPIASPPTDLISESLHPTILIDARTHRAAEIAATLASLRDQTCRNWTACCVIDQALAGHPVVSMTHRDDRIRFSVGEPDGQRGDLTLLMAAGTILDPQALAWFSFVRMRTGCTAIYADHDHANETWRGQRAPRDPVLQPAFDPDWFGSGLSVPAVICVASDRIDSHSAFSAARGIRLCTIAEEGGTIVHIPRILSTVLDVVADVASAPPGPEDANAGNIAFTDLVDSKGYAATTATIAVLIPTRDQADMLATCIATLMDKARDKSRIEIIIVDNRSREENTTTILADLERRYAVRSVSFDEPFNWSRANNVAARASSADLLLFLNNDTEMQTQGWDDLIAAELARADIGLIGARLLYPDHTVQHAGIIFGVGDGSPRHEGVGSASSDGGPEGRWLRRRSVNAVTGAVMAMRRSVWNEVGGFNEDLAVGYNDVDMCLRVRERDYRILYAPDLSLIHHESKTRGMNVNRSQVAWDRAELRTLYLSWGDALFRDSSMNLQWNRQGAAFEAFEEPTPSAILDDIDRQISSPSGLANARGEKGLRLS